MSLTIHDRSSGDRTRAVQLINKTNQFNLNGRRWSDVEVEGFLKKGGRLFTASLTDRIGDHGEILALLIDAKNVVHAFVLSCRVFQRRIEHAILLWLLQNQSGAMRFLADRTEKNEPFWQFIADPSFTKCDDGFTLDVPAFQQKHESVMSSFQVNFKE